MIALVTSFTQQYTRQHRASDNSSNNELVCVCLCGEDKEDKWRRKNGQRDKLENSEGG